MSIPGRRAEECFARRDDPLDDFLGPLVMVLFRGVRFQIEKSNQALIDAWLPDQLGSGKRADAGGDGMCALAAAFNEGCNTLTAELPDCGVGRKASRASRKLRVPIHL